jgi:hypothetical protein
VLYTIMTTVRKVRKTSRIEAVLFYNSVSCIYRTSLLLLVIVTVIVNVNVNVHMRTTYVVTTYSKEYYGSKSTQK